MGAEADRDSGTDIERALRERTAERRQFEGLSYIRFTDDVPGGPGRGAVLIGDRRIPTYPHIGRVFVLEEGIRRMFDGPFVAEEKIDGYHVRVVRAEGRILAFTRGGFVCPFTTDRLTDLADLDPLFDAEPDAVLCGELAGPGNPYLHGQVPLVPEDVGFFAFDLMRLGRAGFVDLAERDAILERHGVPRAPHLGRFRPDELERLRSVVMELDERGAEGMVLKAEDGGRRVKYVTPSVNLADIVEDATLLAELPGEFFSGRIVRLVIGLEELGLQDRMPAVAERLGQALIEDFARTVREFRETGVVSHTFRVRMHSEQRADALVGHLKHASGRVNVKEVSRGRRDGWIHLELRKDYQRSTGWLNTVLEGAPVVD